MTSPDQSDKLKDDIEKMMTGMQFLPRPLEIEQEEVVEQEEQNENDADEHDINEDDEYAAEMRRGERIRDAFRFENAGRSVFYIVVNWEDGEMETYGTTNEAVSRFSQSYTNATLYEVDPSHTGEWERVAVYSDGDFEIVERPGR